MPVIEEDDAEDEDDDEEEDNDHLSDEGICRGLLCMLVGCWGRANVNHFSSCTSAAVVIWERGISASTRRQAVLYLLSLCMSSCQRWNLNQQRSSFIAQSLSHYAAPTQELV